MAQAQAQTKDPLNRDGLGGNPAAVHKLLSVMKRTGWSDNETEGAVCVQIIPGDKTVEEFNKRFFEGLANCKSDDERKQFKKEYASEYTPQNWRFGKHDPEL